MPFSFRGPKSAQIISIGRRGRNHLIRFFFGKRKVIHLKKRENIIIFESPKQRQAQKRVDCVNSKLGCSLPQSQIGDWNKKHISFLILLLEMMISVWFWFEIPSTAKKHSCPTYLHMELIITCLKNSADSPFFATRHTEFNFYFKQNHFIQL